MEIIEKIINSLEDMSENQYNQFRQFKFIQFNQEGSFIGGSHYEFTESPFPDICKGKIYNIVPMNSQTDLIGNLKYNLNNPDEKKGIEDPEKHLGKNEIENYIFGMHSDSYNRLSRFYDVESKINPNDYEDIFRRVYSSSWKNYHYRRELRHTFSIKISSEEIMTEDEAQVIRALPEKIIVYRVMSRKEAESNDYGVSWTLWRNVAEQLGEMYFSDIYVHSGFQILELEIYKSEIVAFFNDYRTMEIIYLHKD